jgi:hypothetical protein
LTVIEREQRDPATVAARVDDVTALAARLQVTTA